MASAMAGGKGAHGGLEIMGCHGQQQGALQPAADANQKAMGRRLRGFNSDGRAVPCQTAQIGFRFNRSAAHGRGMGSMGF